ncbi:cysteine desulfurase family protein [Pseudonocardia acaciae]|uniref:cysteine desulfurase family protein n=1 Tax=Pseudonocardia acaciae TaxID=551276 RepID=UPI00048D1CEF|nr:cysteine desulfurase family protein [Pseudonocardia acaciae]
MSHPGLEGRPIYLDHNATTPVDPRVVEAALPYLSEHFGNPSSAHAYARAPRHALHSARERVGALIGARPEEVVFTGGGSEADAMAIRGAARAHRDRGSHVVTQVTEHPAVLETCAGLEVEGFRVTYLPVDRYGWVDPADLRRALAGHDTALVSIMAANAETGTLQPVAELAALAREHGALFHTDAAQAVGKIAVDVEELGVDLLTVVGHKMYAPKGVGALYLRAGTRLEPLVRGGGQEGGLRAGTENVALIVALGAAAEIARHELPDEAERLAELRDRLHRRLVELLPGRVRLNGDPGARLPGTLNVSITRVRGAELLAATPGIAASTGSACHEGEDRPSPVLTAMGLSAEHAMGALRLSLGRWTTDADVDRAADLVAASVRSADHGSASGPSILGPAAAR